MEQCDKTQMQVLMSFLRMEGYIFHTQANTSTYELEDLFFAHPASLQKWRAFPHVLLIDATYKTNKYGLPLVEIVGLSSTNKTFSIVFVFMDKEKESNYTWALECLKSTMDGCMSPRVIVTHREFALMNACSKVFPEAKGLLCRWHISRNIMKKCRRYFQTNSHWYAFNNLWGQLINSETVQVYMNNLIRLQSCVVTCPDVIDYLDDYWLIRHKEMFVSAWTNQCLNFGNDTTNRVESQHAKLKKYLGDSQSDLVTALSKIHDLVQSQDTLIKASLERSKIFIQQEFNIPHFQQLVRVVSIHALELMLNEYKRSVTVGVFSENCGCKLRPTHGLPCAHEQAMYMAARQPIPIDAVDVFWIKLDLTPCYLDDEQDIDCEVELQKFTEVFKSQSSKFSFLKKLKEILAPASSSLCEPTVHKNIRGRPRMKRNVNHVPIKPDEPRQHDSFSAPPMSHPYMNQVQEIFHPHISRVDDVRGDGNCGFRSVAVGFGHNEKEWPTVRRNLLEELSAKWEEYATMFGLTSCYGVYNRLNFFDTSVFAPEEHWMRMPEIGVLVASRYNVMFHVLNKIGSTTYLPLWTAPSVTTTQNSIAIAFVNNNHYIHVALTGEYPIPRVEQHWFYHRNESATAWIAPYMERIHTYEQYLTANSTVEYVNLED